MGVRIFNCCVVFLTLLYVSYGTIDAAVIKRAEDSSHLAAPKNDPWQVRAVREANSEEDSDSAEADDEEVQVQELAQQQQQFSAAAQDDSDEADDDESDADDDQDDDDNIRRRRETPAAAAEIMKQSEFHVKETETLAVPEPLPAPPAVSVQTTAVKEPAPTEATNTAATTPQTPVRNTSVLILIRDALKKVTTLPTEQVATNALQYFQLFEHFIQQTIEEVISDDDDDDEDEAVTEATAANAEVTTIQPESIFTPEEVGIIAGVEEILKEPELVSKQPLVQKPTEAQVESMINHQLFESEAAAVVGQTKPVPGGPTIEGEKAQIEAEKAEKAQKMSAVSETATKKASMTVKESITVKKPATIDESGTNSV